MAQAFWLASYPRSGNTAVRLWLEHHFNVDTREVRGARITRQHKKNLAEVQALRSINAAAPIVALKTHSHEPNEAPYRMRAHGYLGSVANLPALVLIRDGRQSLVSYAHYQSEIEGKRSFVKNLEHLARSDAWSRFYTYWLERRASPWGLLRYEDLVVAAEEQAEAAILFEALASLGLNPSFKSPEYTSPVSFRALHQSNPRFFRKGLATGWQAELPTDLEAAWWELNGATMLKWGYLR